MTRAYNKNASRDKAVEIALRTKKAQHDDLFPYTYDDPNKWSIGDLRRKKKGLERMIREINKALVKRGYPAEITKGGVS